MTTRDPLRAALATDSKSGLHVIARMLCRPADEVELKLDGALPFTLSEIIVLADHLGMDWKLLLADCGEGAVH